MFNTIKAKAQITLFVFFLIGSIGLYSYISYGYDKIASENTREYLNTVADSIFQTVRTSMGFGDADIVRKTLKNAKSIQGVKNVEIFKSKKIRRLKWVNILN